MEAMGSKGVNIHGAASASKTVRHPVMHHRTVISPLRDIGSVMRECLAAASP